MIYYKCKCGKSESWSSMGVPACRVCKYCGTTLDGSEPIPHDVITEELTVSRNGITTTNKRSYCVNCMKTVDANENLPKH